MVCKAYHTFGIPIKNNTSIDFVVILLLNNSTFTLRTDSLQIKSIEFNEQDKHQNKCTFNTSAAT